MQKTKKLYMEDVYMSECTATVLNYDSDSNRLLLDRTVFFPEGGGQPSDIGWIDSIPVSQVHEKDGLVFHLVDGHFKTGDLVNVKIDWDNRFIQMQRHCGEHILSGVFYREYGGINRGFHMGDDYMTIDISLEKDPAYTTLTENMMKRVEILANQQITTDEAVTSFYFEDGVAASSMQMRKPLALDSDITIVCAGDKDDPANCVACCGTHPTTTGQVGLIKIYKFEKNKDMYRIFFDAGTPALNYCMKTHRAISILNELFSANLDNLLEKVTISMDKSDDMHRQLASTRKTLTQIRVDNVLSSLSAVDVQTPDAHVQDDHIHVFSDADSDDLGHMQKLLHGKIPFFLILASTVDHSCLLMSTGAIDCNSAVEMGKEKYCGRGGGKKDSARISFPSNQQMLSFLTACRELR